MRSVQPSFEKRVSRRVDELEAETQVAYEHTLRWKATKQAQEVEMARQREARAAREHNRQGYLPEEVWGEGSGGAKACNEFIAFMATHDFPGSTLLTHKEKVSRPFFGRWLRKDVVEDPGVGDGTWSIRGYGIGYTLGPRWTRYATLVYEGYNCTYPLPKGYHQDIFLCEDGMVRRFSWDTLGPLDTGLAPDQPYIPRIGACSKDDNHSRYGVNNAELDDLLVQIAAHHTQAQAET